MNKCVDEKKTTRKDIALTLGKRRTKSDPIKYHNTDMTGYF